MSNSQQFSAHAFKIDMSLDSISPPLPPTLYMCTAIDILTNEATRDNCKQVLKIKVFFKHMFVVCQTFIIISSFKKSKQAKTFVK